MRLRDWRVEDDDEDDGSLTTEEAIDSIEGGMPLHWLHADECQSLLATGNYYIDWDKHTIRKKLDKRELQ